MLLLFIATGLPLEAKALATCFLLAEWRCCRQKLYDLVGDFSFHIDGICHYKNVEYHVVKVHFFSRWLILLDIKKDKTSIRLPLCFDAINSTDFCHLSRICLALRQTG